MAFQVAGKLHKTFDIEKKTETFQAREFILEVSESQYPQLIKFQLTQDKCELIDAYQSGETITVHFDLRGREWNDRFFTNLNAWRIETGDSTANAPTEKQGAGSQSAAGNTATASKSAEMDFDDDIPF